MDRTTLKGDFVNIIRKITDNCYYIPSIKRIAKCKNTMMEDELIQYISRKFCVEDKNPFIKTKEAYPIEISLFPSIACSMKCSYCYYCSGEQNDSAKDLTRDQLDTIIDWLIKNSTVRKFVGKDNTIKVTLTGGGEPTFNWDNFRYFIDNLKNKADVRNIDTYFILITNGVLTEKKIEYICENIDLIQISYDGNTVLQNNNRKLINGKGSADYVENTMEMLSQKGKKFCVRSTIQSCDYDKIYEMTMNIFTRYKYAMTYHIEPMQYTGRGSDLQKDSLKDNNIFIDEYIRTKNEVMKSFPEKRFYSNLFEYKDIQIVCTSASGGSVIIDNNGYLFPCSERLEIDKASIGSIKDGKVSMINDNFIEKEYKKMLKTECGNCMYFSLCAGGCFSSFKRNENGELIDEGKVKCKLVKDFWERAYKELAKSNEFLDMRLVKEESLNSWDIYSVVV